MEGIPVLSAGGSSRTKTASTSSSSSIPMMRDKPPTPYRLREGSKLPSRYRDVEEPPGRTRSPAKTKMQSPRKSLSIASSSASSPARRALNDRAEPVQNQHNMHSQPAVSNTNSFGSSVDSYIDVGDAEFPVLEEQPSTSYPPSQAQQSQPQMVTVSKTSSYSNLSMAGGSDGSQHAYSPLVLDDDATNKMSQDGTARKTKQEKEREVLGEKVGLKRLQHVLFLNKARRWSICEFFYSAVDEQLFLAENEFSQIMQESFPNLKTMMLNKQQWRTIRRLLGKPRRCSPLFFSEERHALEQKRAKIRSIYDGTYLAQATYDISDLPMRLPRPLVVGMRIYARITEPKDGLYGGTIDAVLKNGYRVVFEKEDMIPPKVIPDHQVMLDGRLELVPISYFIEQSSAKLPFTVPRHNVATSTFHERRHDIIALAHNSSLAKRTGAVADTAQVDRVGNFPVRMLVILVKLSKLIDAKKRLVRQLSELNAEAERANLLTDSYHPSFQEKFAQVVVDLEALNKQMSIYLQGIKEYNSQLIPQIGGDSNIISRPDTLRRVCSTHAHQIVKHCNQGLNVHNPRAVTLVTSLTALLLQIRTLGQQKITPLDLHTLSESINEIRSVISAKNVAWFQDHVEVHMKQIHQTMLQKGAFTG